MRIFFRGKDIKTGEWVYGDLANVILNLKSGQKVKTYIVKHKATGGMLYVTERHIVDEHTIETVPSSSIVHSEI